MNTTHTHVFRGSQRTIVITIDEWPDLIYFRMIADRVGNFNDAREFDRFVGPIFARFKEDPRPQRMYENLTGK